MDNHETVPRKSVKSFTTATGPDGAQALQLLLANRPETGTSGFINSKTSLAYQTFRSPHHSDNEKLFNKPERPNQDNLTHGAHGYRKSHSSPRQVGCGLQNQDSANLFIIKCQSKSRVQKAKRILTLDPLNRQISREGFSGISIRSQTATHQERKTVDLELPSESQWVFNSQSLQRLPRARVQQKPQNTMQNNHNNTTSNAEPMSIRSKLLTAGAECLLLGPKRPTQPKSMKMISPLTKLLKPQQIKDPELPSTIVSSTRLIPRAETAWTTGVGLSPSHEMIKHAFFPSTRNLLATANLAKDQTEKLIRPRSMKESPTLVIRRFKAIFQSPINKSREGAFTNRDSSIGESIVIDKKESMRGSSPDTYSTSGGDRLSKSSIQSPGMLKEGFNLSFKTGSERSSIRISKTDSQTSLSSSITACNSEKREKRKSPSMSRGQVKVLNKIFKLEPEAL